MQYSMVLSSFAQLHRSIVNSPTNVGKMRQSEDSKGQIPFVALRSEGTGLRSAITSVGKKFFAQGSCTFKGCKVFFTSHVDKKTSI